MGLELAQELGVIMIARAKGKHFLVYNGAEHIIYDARPQQQHHKILRARHEKSTVQNDFLAYCLCYRNLHKRG